MIPAPKTELALIIAIIAVSAAVIFQRSCVTTASATELRVIKLPYTLSNWKGDNTTHIFCNKRMEQPLWRALKCVRGRNLVIRTYDGCYSHRYIRGTQRLSKHAEGLAIDIDAKWNRKGTEGDLDFRIVDCFKRAGFIWGGQWKVPDFMHFELPNIKEKNK